MDDGDIHTEKKNNEMVDTSSPTTIQFWSDPVQQKDMKSLRVSTSALRLSIHLVCFFLLE